MPAQINFFLILEWVLLQVFTKSIITRGLTNHSNHEAKVDPSNDHVIFTFETLHPYLPNESMRGAICLPGATKIIIDFDKRSNTELNIDTLVFYEDEDCTKEAKNEHRQPLVFR